MDTSIRLALILGDHKVAIESLPKDERVSILLRLLLLCRAQFTYLPGFKEIRTLMNFPKEDGYNSRQTDLSIVTWGDSMRGDGTDRVMSLASVSHTTDGINPAGPSAGVHFFTQNDLMLAQTGHLYLWTHRYRRDVTSGLGFRQHRTGVTEQAVSSALHRVDAQHLEALLEPNVFKDAVTSILSMARMGLAESEKRTQSKRMLLGHLEMITHLIDGGFSF